MIAYLRGKVVQKEHTFVIIDVEGIGYQVFISLQTYSQIEEGAIQQLYTYFLVREDAQLLYGFFEPSEKQLFIRLISVSGIGANTAMVILSSLSTEEVYEAIANEDVSTIQSIKGIGKKTAQRLILELKDKIEKDSVIIAETSSSPTKQIKEEALMALIALGVSKNVAEKQINQLLKEKGNQVSVEELIKLALKM